MSSQEIVFRYAQALHNLSASTEVLKKELMTISELVDQVPALRSFLLAPHINRSEKERILQVVLKRPLLPEVKQFVSILLQKGRMKYFSDIVNTYQRLLTKQANILEVELVTSVAIEGFSELMKKKLEVFYQKRVVIKEIINSELIGGFILIIGNQIMDGSLKQKLSELRKHLLEGAFRV